MAPRRILVTAALPYANGPIHIGHLVEYIRTNGHYTITDLMQLDIGFRDSEGIFRDIGKFSGNLGERIG